MLGITRRTKHLRYRTVESIPKNHSEYSGNRPYETTFNRFANDFRPVRERSRTNWTRRAADLSDTRHDAHALPGSEFAVSTFSNDADAVPGSEFALSAFSNDADAFPGSELAVSAFDLVGRLCLASQS